MEDCTITIHQDHGGRKVEEASGQSQDIVRNEVGLTNQQPINVKMETTGRDHNQRI